MSVGDTSAITSRLRSARPATMPAAAAASIPLSPPVWGTTTLFAFLMILPLAATSTRTGRVPSSSRARAAANAMAIGSVHPIAATSSSSRMATYCPYRSSVRSMKHSFFAPPVACNA